MGTETITIKALLEAGVHFGHSTTRWNPKMKSFIFGKRDKIHIVDLQQSQRQITNAYNVIKDIASKGGTVLFVGTKRQAQEIVMEEAIRADMPYVITRWLGGTLTNFHTIKKRIDKLLEMEKMEEEGTTNVFTKKELAKFAKAKQRLLRNLGGIKHMSKHPQALFIIDAKHETTAVKEAKRLKIPVVALIDTNSDPDDIDHFIVGNDDAIKSIKVIVSKITDAILEGKNSIPKKAAPTTETKPQEKEEKS